MTARGKSAERIVIVGGGVIGGFCAWELARAGWQVTILEQHKFGAGCSHGNCGYVSPSHLLPLAQPGTVTKTLRAMLKSNSPFSIRPGWSLQSINWFWHFMRCCNHRQMMFSAQGLHALLQSSKQKYQQHVQDRSLDCQWKEKGILFVFEHQADFENYAATEQLIRERFGVGAEAYATQALIELEPTIKPIVAGAWHYLGDCHLCPDQLMQALRQQLEQVEVAIVEGVAVNEVVHSNGKIQSVKTSKGTWNASHYVLATGAQTATLGRMLGCNVPIQPGKGYSITMPCPQNMPATPIIFEDSHVAITPFKNRLRIGSTMEFVGFDSSIRSQRIRLLRASAERYLTTSWNESLEEQWYGWRPMTWDSMPLIGRIPRLENAWICAGHGMLGISTAPASGQLIRELILQQTPHIDPEYYSMQRVY